MSLQSSAIRGACALACYLLAPLAGGAFLLAAQQPPAGSVAPATGTIEGRVVDAARRAPLPGVVVRVEATRLGAVTDADGQFTIAAVPAGEQAIVVQRVGVEGARRAVTVTAGAVARVDLALGETPSIMAPVVVSATRETQRRAEASATIDVLDGAEVRRTGAAHPAGIMNRVPGVHVSELSGEGHSMAIRQPITTKPVYLFLEDGVPTRATGFFNHNALYEVNIPQSGGVEVLKGPGTALYGSDAIGGVVNVLTREPPATPGGEVSVEGGEHGYARLLASGGFRTPGHGLRADVNVTRSDNWKADAPFRRRSGTVRWDAYDVGGWMARTTLTASSIDQQDVPAVDAARFATSPRFNIAPIAYRHVEAVRLTSALERENGASLWSLTPYARYNVLDLLPSWQLSYDPQTWESSNRSVGLLAKYRRDLEPLRARVILGADADWSPGRFVARQAVLGPRGEDGAYRSYTDGETHYDYDVTYRSLSPYVHAELSPLARVRVDAGVRYDVAGYDYRNRLTPLDTGAHRRPASTTVSYRHLSPKLGVTVEAAPWLGLFASYRHGFRAPSQGQLFQQNSAEHTVGLEPVKVDSYEAGIRGEVGGRFVYQLSAYDMRLRDDILTFVTPENRRVATNAGATRHRGVELGVGAALLRTLRLDASYSLASHRYEEWVPQAARPASGATPARPAVDYSGNRIEQAPRDLAGALLTWRPALLGGGRLAVEWSHTGRYAMDAANHRDYAGYDLLHLHASARLSAGAELFARLTNATDRAYAELASYSAFRAPADREEFTPGAPRSLYVGVRYAWSR